MAYRHPYNRALRSDKFTRPPMPKWLDMPREKYIEQGKAAASYDYWRTMYYATPPWLSDDHVAQMRAMHNARAPSEQLDHIVPLRGKTVCGLNVPWNLQLISKLENQDKSNNHWPGMPMQPVDMFDEYKFEPFELSTSAGFA